MTTHSRRRRKSEDDLCLHQELMLLAIRDEKGTVISSSTVVYQLAGALIAELLIQEAIVVEGKKKQVRLVDDGPLGDPLLDECIAKIKKEKKPKSLKEWVLKFVNIKKLKHRVVHGLIDRHILRIDEDSVLLIFKQKIYPQLDPGPERRIVERLRRAIFRSTRTVDPRTVVLISLAKSGGLLNHLFDRGDVRERKDRIKQIIAGEATGKAAKEAAEAAQAAAMVAVMAGSAAASAGSR